MYIDSVLCGTNEIGITENLDTMFSWAKINADNQSITKEHQDSPVATLRMHW